MKTKMNSQKQTISFSKCISVEFYVKQRQMKRIMTILICFRFQALRLINLKTFFKTLKTKSVY